MLNLESTKFLNDEQIKELAPSVFSTSPAANLSKHYVHMPTSSVINDMRTLGWDVVDVKEVKSRKTHTKGNQKHLVVFRNPEISITNKEDVVFPQILLTNSSDGKSCFKFTAGLFRMICENGLVISTETFNDVKIRHMGYSFEYLKTEIHRMVEELPLTVDSMNKMRETVLGEEQALKLARKALTTRFKVGQIPHIKVDLSELLRPLREEDKGNDLWSIFNVLQEKVLSGDFDYMKKGKYRKAREVKNFNQDQKINKELFEMAVAYIN